MKSCFYLWAIIIFAHGCDSMPVNRSKEPSKEIIQIDSIGFNFAPWEENGSQAIPLFDLDRGFIDAPEWKVNNPKPSIAAYVRGNAGLDSGAIDSITVKVWLTNHKSGNPVKLWFEWNGERSEIELLYPSPKQQPIYLSVRNPFQAVNIHETTWKWYYQEKGSSPIHVETTKHKFFSLLAPPVSPMHNPNWVQVLDSVCTWAKGLEDSLQIAKAVTDSFNELDIYGQNCSSKLVRGCRCIDPLQNTYTSLSAYNAYKKIVRQIYLQKFFNRLFEEKRKQKDAVVVNCFDVSYLLSNFLKSIGINPTVYIIQPVGGEDSKMPLGKIDVEFKTDKINLIGSPQYDSGLCGRRGWFPQTYSIHTVLQIGEYLFDPYFDLGEEDKGGKVCSISPTSLSREQYLGQLIEVGNSLSYDSLRWVKAPSHTFNQLPISSHKILQGAEISKFGSWIIIHFIDQDESNDTVDIYLQKFSDREKAENEFNLALQSNELGYSLMNNSDMSIKNAKIGFNQRLYIRKEKREYLLVFLFRSCFASLDWDKGILEKSDEVVSNYIELLERIDSSMEIDASEYFYFIIGKDTLSIIDNHIQESLTMYHRVKVVSKFPATDSVLTQFSSDNANIIYFDKKVQFIPTEIKDGRIGIFLQGNDQNKYFMVQFKVVPVS